MSSSGFEDNALNNNEWKDLTQWLYVLNFTCWVVGLERKRMVSWKPKTTSTDFLTESCSKKLEYPFFYYCEKTYILQWLLNLILSEITAAKQRLFNYANWFKIHNLKLNHLSNLSIIFVPDYILFFISLNPDHFYPFGKPSSPNSLSYGHFIFVGNGFNNIQRQTLNSNLNVLDPSLDNDIYIYTHSYIHITFFLKKRKYPKQMGLYFRKKIERFVPLSRFCHYFFTNNQN